MITNCSFDSAKNKLDCYKDKDCMEKFCKDLRKYAMKIINYEQKEMMQLIDEENRSYEGQKVCYICKKDFSTNDDDKDVIFRGVAHDICNLRSKTPKEIPVVFHNGSTYHYQFIVNQLAKAF